MPDYNHESDRRDQAPQAKRRRLDTDYVPSSAKRHRYGHYGQVVPGVLRLSLADRLRCVYGHGDVSYQAENLLRNDRSVFCSAHSTCELVLTHHDDAPFTLEKLCIVAPDRGFSAPYVKILHARIQIDNAQNP